MKKQFLIAASLFLSVVGFAQTPAIEFTYDSAGNRIQRKVIYIQRPQNPPSAPTTGVNAEVADTLQDRTAHFTYNLFPNPTAGLLNINTTEEIGPSDKVTIAVFTIDGKQMMLQNFVGTRSIQLNLGEQPWFATGEYVVKWTSTKSENPAQITTREWKVVASW